jgi:hypothetical protein
MSRIAKGNVKGGQALDAICNIACSDQSERARPQTGSAVNKSAFQLPKKTLARALRLNLKVCIVTVVYTEEFQGESQTQPFFLTRILS